MAMANRRMSFGFSALAALLLGGITFLAAPPAQAGGEPEFDLDPALAACIYYELSTEFQFELCEFEFSCEPEERNCEHVCRHTRVECGRSTKELARVIRRGFQGILNSSKILCGTSDDRNGCKSFLNFLRIEANEVYQLALRGLGEACAAEELVEECETSCNAGSDWGDVCDIPV